MSLEIKKANAPGVNDFLLKRGSLVKHLVLRDGNIDPQLTVAVAGKLANLQSVTVDGSTESQDKVADDDMTALRQICSASQISKVSLNKLSHISVSLIDEFIGSFNTLTSLTLSYCENVSDGSLSNLAKCCKNLKIISLRSTNIGDGGLSALSSNCSSLISADFSECASVTDFGVELVALNNRNLQEINVNKCPQVTENALVSLANSCSNLHTISMESTGIQRLPSAVVCLEKLRQLKLLGCKKLNYPIAADSEVVQKAYTADGFKQLLTYFLDYQLTYRIKVFVIGEPGVGKSALIKCLTYDNPLLIPQGNSFPGVSLWDPSSSITQMPAHSGKYIFEIWELPDDIVGLGDVFYIDTAIYIVAFDLTDVDGIDSAIRSVTSVWARVPNACIIVVGTHADALSPGCLSKNLCEADQKFKKLLNIRKNVAKQLVEKISDFKSLFLPRELPKVCQSQIAFLSNLSECSEVENLIQPVSCRSRTGIAELRQLLLKRCTEHRTLFPQLSYRLTPALVQLYEDIRQLRSRSVIILPLSEFAYFAERAGIRQQNIESDTTFLHNAGIIFDFRYLTKSVANAESFICIDPARFLELFSCIHLPNNSLTDESMNYLIEQGQILGRLLPHYWKLSDTDQLELIENVTRLLGVICTASAALPPATWDKSLPPLPLNAHRCAFVRRVYSLPHFFNRLPKITRPIHWQPELSTDDIQLSIQFQIPKELVFILESAFQRIIASLPSCYHMSRLKTVGMLHDFDLSNGKMLLCFILDYSQPIEVHMCVCLSQDLGIDISARVNISEIALNSIAESPRPSELIASLILWFHCVSVARNVYSRITAQLGGVPMSLNFSSKGCSGNETALQLSEMLLLWQNEDSNNKFIRPPVSYPPEDGMESLDAMFEYAEAKLELMLNIKEFDKDNSKFHTKPDESKPVVIGAGIVVNDGCFRRGKSKHLSVQFYDEFRNRHNTSSIGSTFNDPASSTHHYYYSPSLVSRSGLNGFTAFPDRLWPAQMRLNYSGNENRFSVNNERFIENEGEANDCELDENVAKDSINGDCNDYTDRLSGLSSIQATDIDPLLLLHDSTLMSKRHLVYAKQNRRRHRSPPPANSLENKDVDKRVSLAEEEDDFTEENIPEFPPFHNRAVDSIHANEPSSCLSSSSVSLSVASPYGQVTETLTAKPRAQSTSCTSNVTVDKRRSPDTPIALYRTPELESLSPPACNEMVRAGVFQNSNRSSPMMGRRTSPSSCTDSGMLIAEDDDTDVDKYRNTNSENKNPPVQMQEGQMPEGTEDISRKIATKEMSHRLTTPLSESKAEQFIRSSTVDMKSPSSNKRNIFKLSSFSLRRRKSSISDDAEGGVVCSSPIPGDVGSTEKKSADKELVNGSVANLVQNIPRRREGKSRKDRAKCLCS